VDIVAPGTSGRREDFEKPQVKLRFYPYKNMRKIGSITIPMDLAIRKCISRERMSLICSCGMR